MLLTRKGIGTTSDASSSVADEMLVKMLLADTAINLHPLYIHHVLDIENAHNAIARMAILYVLVRYADAPDATIHDRAALTSARVRIRPTGSRDGSLGRFRVVPSPDEYPQAQAMSRPCAHAGRCPRI